MAVKKFLKFDAEKGFLDNKDDINYFATKQMRKVVFGGMLGDFDENGFYVVNQKIVNELLAMPKVIVDAVEGSELIRSKVKADTFFHFILSIEGDKATFSLLEKVYHQSNRTLNGGSYSDINEYVLDEVIVPDRDFNRNALYEKYNINPHDDGEALSIFDASEETIALYFNILEKIKINYLTQNKLILNEQQIEEIEVDYFDKVLKLINQYPTIKEEFSKDVQDVLKEKSAFIVENNPFFQQTVNEIVDANLERISNKLDDEQKQEFLNKLRVIKAEYYNAIKNLLSIQIKQSAGVKFNSSQMSQEAIIGSLVKEVEGKGYTSSDIRRILIDDSELQLSIEKIKSMIEENAKQMLRPEIKKDLVKGREEVKNFYTELHKEAKIENNQDKSLIGDAIAEEKVEKKGIIAKATANTSASTAAKKPVSKSAGGGGKAKGASQQKKAAPNKAKTSTVKKGEVSSKPSNTEEKKIEFKLGYIGAASVRKQNKAEEEIKTENKNVKSSKEFGIMLERKDSLRGGFSKTEDKDDSFSIR